MRRNSRDAGLAEHVDEELDILVRLEDALRDARLELRTQTQTQAAFSAAEQQRFESLVRAFQQASTQTDALRREVSQQMGQTREATEVRLEAVRASVEQQLAAIRQDNERQLEQMRQTVDEKLSRKTHEKEPLKTEQDLLKILPHEYWESVNHQWISFGREICSARSPKCAECPLADLCPSCN